MKIYRHYRPWLFKMPLITFGLLAVGLLAALVWSVSHAAKGAPPFPVFLIGAVFVPHIWIYEFVGVLRRTKVAVGDIRSIAPTSYPQIYIARCSRGNVRFEGRLNGLHELITEIKRRNPSVELSGI